MAHLVRSDITSALKRITLNDLPQWYPPAARLIAGPADPIAPRDSQTACKVYDEQTYGPLLQYAEAQSQRVDAEAVRRHQLRTQVLGPRGLSGDGLCVSVGDALYEIDIACVDRLGYSFLCDGLAEVMPSIRTLVDLGGGYGFTLHCLKQDFPWHRYAGADLSELAVRLGRRLFADDPAVSFHHFDLCRSRSYDFLAQLEGPLAIVTSGAMVLLQSTTCVFEALARYRSMIHAVLHWEPIYQPHDHSLLGLLRRRTMQQFSYNRDLPGQIQNRKDIRVVSKRSDVFGVNPLLPYSLLHWEFTESDQ